LGEKVGEDGKPVGNRFKRGGNASGGDERVKIRLSGTEDGFSGGSDGSGIPDAVFPGFSRFSYELEASAAREDPYRASVSDDVRKPVLYIGP